MECHAPAVVLERSLWISYPYLREERKEVPAEEPDRAVALPELLHERLPRDELRLAHWDTV